LLVTACNPKASVVWSHYHWHHVGNVSLFPPSTSLFVGPGFSSSPNLVPGFPENPDSPISSADLANRRVCEVDFSISGLEIGGFRAFDFFSDGSFYLLGKPHSSSLRLPRFFFCSSLNLVIDTPGHCIGHVCGLARTMAAPNQSTFVFMGGDIAHFGGTFRPSHNLPLPDEIPANVLDKDSAFPIPCPCNFFTDQHPQSSASPRSTPFYNISTDKSSAYIQPPTAQNSVNKLARMDASPRVLVCFAHDPATLRYLPTLNDSPELDLNDWKSQGWKEKCHWNWLNYLSRAGKSGRAPTYKGFWRDGRPWPEASEYLRERGAGAKGTGL
jgi:hypothetical protein